jgi:hypothetical protein
MATNCDVKVLGRIPAHRTLEWELLVDGVRHVGGVAGSARQISFPGKETQATIAPYVKPAVASPILRTVAAAVPMAEVVGKASREAIVAKRM